jgi:hypothetical protein
LVRSPYELDEYEIGISPTGVLWIGLSNREYYEFSGRRVVGKTASAGAGASTGGGATGTTGTDLSGIAGVVRVEAGTPKGNSTTSHVPEGSRLYFTNARFYAAAKAMLLAGDGITITADDEAMTLTIDATSGGGGSHIKLRDGSLIKLHA